VTNGNFLICASAHRHETAHDVRSGELHDLAK